jgi:hypothetical protein
MIRTRRCVLLLVLTVAVVLGASLPANALFADTAAPATKPAITTAVVTGPSNVKVDTSCTTTTRVIKRVFDSTTNAQLSYSDTTSTPVTSTSNVESDTTVRTDNSPVVGQYTTTQTIKNTTLYATGRWKASPTPGITGYKLTAFLAGGLQYDMGTAGVNDTTTVGEYDASVLSYSPRLSIVTVTYYGWTAPGSMSAVVTC